MGNHQINSAYSIFIIGFLSTIVLGLPLYTYIFQTNSNDSSSKRSSHLKDDDTVPPADLLPDDAAITPQQPIIEISVSDIESAYQAWSGGANSLELCANRSEGGTTPSLGLVEECLSRFQLQGCLEIHVLIRPRPGNFVYSGRP